MRFTWLQPRVKLLGGVGGVDESIVLMIGDAEIVARWHGVETRDLTDKKVGAVPTRFDGGELLAVIVGDGGWVSAARVRAGIMLVEHEYSYFADPEGNGTVDPELKSSSSQQYGDRTFVDWVASPLDARELEVGRFRIESGRLGILPEQLPGRDLAKHGMLIKLPAGDYAIHADMVGRGEDYAWMAARALIKLIDPTG